MGSVWGLCGIPVRSVWDPYGICMGFVLGLYGACVGSLWDLYWICMVILWDLYGACMGSVGDSYGICVGLVLDPHWICKEFVLGLHKGLHGIPIGFLWGPCGMGDLHRPPTSSTSGSTSSGRNSCKAVHQEPPTPQGALREPLGEPLKQQQGSPRVPLGSFKEICQETTKESPGAHVMSACVCCIGLYMGPA